MGRGERWTAVGAMVVLLAAACSSSGGGGVASNAGNTRETATSSPTVLGWVGTWACTFPDWGKLHLVLNADGSASDGSNTGTWSAQGSFAYVHIPPKGPYILTPGAAGLSVIPGEPTARIATPAPRGEAPCVKQEN